MAAYWVDLKFKSRSILAILEQAETPLSSSTNYFKRRGHLPEQLAREKKITPIRTLTGMVAGLNEFTYSRQHFMFHLQASVWFPSHPVNEFRAYDKHWSARIPRRTMIID
jgi:hypothetical protein